VRPFTSLEAAFSTACDLVAAGEADAAVCGVTVEKSAIVESLFAPLFGIAPPEDGPSLVVEAEGARDVPIVFRIEAIDVVPFEDEDRLSTFVADETFDSLAKAVHALAANEVRSARVVARRPLLGERRARFTSACWCARESREAARSLVLAACAGKPAAAPKVTQEEWSAAREMLGALRARTPDHAYVERVQIALREPRTGKIFEGRGAIAVQPGHALRMILVGPGGSTALDLWITPDRWRLHAPALGPPRHGTTAPPELPIGFFRWWFLAPYDGRLLTIDEGKVVMRSGDSTVRLGISATASHRAHVSAARRTPDPRAGGHEETLEWVGLLAHPAPGDRARYIDATASPPTWSSRP